MTRVIRFHATGGPEVLRIDDIDLPPPGPGEVTIRVKALGLNRAEAMFRRGVYVIPPQFPQRMGYEASGVVETLGAGVEGFTPGDAVSIVPPLSMAEYPAYGELATYPAHLVVKHPASLSWEAAAAVWMQYVTAYGALIDIAQLGQGDVVVIPAASSSVGLAAIQIANRVGAIPVAVTRTRAKAAKLAEAGAAHVIVSDEEKLPARLRDITGGAGARLVFDPVAGPGAEILAEVLAPGGILIEYGLLSGQATPFPLFPALVKGLTMRGYTYAEIVMNPAKLEAAKAFILSGLADGSLTPIIARTFKFEDMVEAHRYLESNEQFGKIVVTL